MEDNKALRAVLDESYDLNISAIVEENPSWSVRMVNDYFSKQSNINSLAGISDADSDRISDNTKAIVVVQGNLDTHEINDSAHGVEGDNVGTLDYCTPILGGVVLLAGNVADAIVMTTVITTTDLAAAPATYSQTYAGKQSDLANECKSKINGIITDLENIKTQLNEILLSVQAAKQMAL